MGEDLVVPGGVFFEGGQLLRIPPRGLEPAHDQPQPGRPVRSQAGQLGDLVGNHVAVGSLDLVDLAVRRSAAVHTFAGSNAMACSSVALTAQPVTQRTRRRLVDNWWR